MPKGQSKMDNPEKLAIQSTQDEEKQNKNTTQYNMCWIQQCGNKHIQLKYEMSPHTNNWR